MAEKSKCHRREDCRLCRSRNLELVFSLTATPPANAFVQEKELNRKQDCFPLDLFFCRSCAHLQLLDVVDPEILFRDYVYVSGTSPVFVEHFRKYADWISSRFGVNPGDSVLEIGSNDGTLLRFFQQRGCQVFGIDPATKIAAQATQAGIPTQADFFTSTLGSKIRAEKGPARVVVANNVFAHIDDLDDVVKGVRALLSPESVFVFEVSYLLDVVQKTLFDTIYHEHLDYHSVIALEKFFQRHEMELIDVLRVESHGGSLRAVARLKDGVAPKNQSVQELIQLEKDAGLDQAQTFRGFARNIDALKSELRSVLEEAKQRGKKIAGFGAPAKATTLMYHFGLGPSDLQYIVDDSPWKQGLFSPGLHVPVVSAAQLKEKPVDYLLILAWNFAAPIMAKNQWFQEAGGKFIVPVPKVEVL